MKYSCIFAIMPLTEVNVDKNRLKLIYYKYYIWLEALAHGFFNAFYCI